ncbi:MAG: hypothetical protein ACTHLW_17880 [Verrucomicrobiota bacterium]
MVFILITGIIVVVAILGSISARKRREAMALLGAQLGLSFSTEKDYAMADRFEFLNQLAHGSNRYAYNIFTGVFRGNEVIACDYHYETHSTDSKGRQQTQHYQLSVFILMLPRNFPEVRISSEGFFSKIAQAFGYDDIDFESAEFSRKFCVRSPDKKFAYDFCNAQMIEYLLANPDLSIEIENRALALVFSSPLAVEQIEPNLRRLVEIRSRMPDYLFTKV